VQTCLYSRFSYDIPPGLHGIYSNSLDALGIIVMHWDKNLQWSWTAHRSLDKAQKCIEKSLKLPGVMTAKKSCQRCNAIISNKLNIETHRLHSSKAFAELTARHIINKIQQVKFLLYHKRASQLTYSSFNYIHQTKESVFFLFAKSFAEGCSYKLW